MPVISITEAKFERARMRLVSDGPEARLLIARHAFLCAAQLSEIAVWLAQNGDVTAAAAIQTYADGVISGAEIIRKGAERDMWLHRNGRQHT